MNVLSEDPTRIPVRELKRMEAELEATRAELKEADWLLGDLEVRSVLEELVEERRKRE